VLLLHEFPERYTVSENTPSGSIDELSWLTADAFGDDPNAVPMGAALFVRGWATDLRGIGPAPAVIVRIDDHHFYEARVGVSRPDVAEALGNNALSPSGFEAVIPTGRFGPGAHTVSIAIIELGENLFAQLVQTVAFRIVDDGVPLPDLPRQTAPSAGVLDEIVDVSHERALTIDDGAVSLSYGAPLYLRGWACLMAPRETFQEIYALVDGRRAYRANAGLSRVDVATELGHLSLERAGFDVQVPTLGLRNGVHEIEILGLTAAGDALVRTPVSVRLRIRRI
jgi:hypothetical protein